MFGLFGPNGAGKSTLMSYYLVLLWKPTSVRVNICRYDLMRAAQGDNCIEYWRSKKPQDFRFFFFRQI